MSCFLVPTAEAIVVSTVKHHCAKKEAKVEAVENKEENTNFVETNKITFSKKLGWLSNLLWGGSFLLAIEHMWHGEIVPYAPFLTAMKHKADIEPMLQEMGTVGVTMAVAVTGVWVAMVSVAKYKEKVVADKKENE